MNIFPLNGFQVIQINLGSMLISFLFISVTIIQKDSNKNQFLIAILNQGFTNYRAYDSYDMSPIAWLMWSL